MKKVKPKFLKKNSEINIIAPSSNLKRDIFKSAQSFYENQGYQIRYQEDIFEKIYFTAGTLERRFMELKNAFENPTSDMVFCARGGAGAYDLLSKELENINIQPWKIFLGGSDNTFLLQYFLKKGNVVFHGPVFSNENLEEKISEENWEILFGKKYVFDNILPIKIDKNMSIEGELIGGCLSIVTAMIGTPYDIDFSDKIIFLEDIGEKPYRITRMLWQMKAAGKFDKVRALIFGEMRNCVQNENQGYSFPELIGEIFKEYKFPIYWGLRSGHSTPNLILPFGINYHLNNNKLSMLESGVLC